MELRKIKKIYYILVCVVVILTIGTAYNQHESKKLLEEIKDRESSYILVEIHNDTIKGYVPVNCNMVFASIDMQVKPTRINGTCYYIQNISISPSESKILHKLDSGTLITYVGE